MKSKLELYINSIEKNLKKLPENEKTDIINELNSYITELKTKDNLCDDDIINKLGSPNELSANYINSYLIKNNSFNLRKVLLIISYISMVSVGSVFVIPTGLILSITLFFSSVVSVLAGIAELIASFFNYDIPFIKFEIGILSSNQVALSLLSILFGVILFFLGILAWKGVFLYIKSMSKVRKKYKYS